jgi:hypothetical protein
MHRSLSALVPRCGVFCSPPPEHIFSLGLSFGTVPISKTGDASLFCDLCIILLRRPLPDRGFPYRTGTRQLGPCNALTYGYCCTADRMYQRTEQVIHRSAWNRNSPKFKSSISHTGGHTGPKGGREALTWCIQGM